MIITEIPSNYHIPEPYHVYMYISYYDICYYMIDRIAGADMVIDYSVLLPVYYLLGVRIQL